MTGINKRRLHMGCGESLQGGFRRLTKKTGVDAPLRRPQPAGSPPVPGRRRGKQP
jgi:hypothetical protein